jgi:hypothetical protein
VQAGTTLNTKDEKMAPATAVRRRSADMANALLSRDGSGRRAESIGRSEEGEHTAARTGLFIGVRARAK